MKTIQTIGAMSTGPNMHAVDHANLSPLLIDVRGAAKLVGCSTRHWVRLCDDGNAPAGVKLGALRRWYLADLMQWVAGGCKPAGAKPTSP